MKNESYIKRERGQPKIDNLFHLSGKRDFPIHRDDPQQGIRQLTDYQLSYFNLLVEKEEIEPTTFTPSVTH